MLRLLPLEFYSPYVNCVCKLLSQYGGLIFSEIESPISVFLNALAKEEVKVIIALKEEVFIAFVALYNFKKISDESFSCYMYGASERKCARELDILLPFIFKSLKEQGCKVIRFETRIYNMPMRILAKRLNFRKVGILENACYSKGKFVSNILYEKTL